MEGSSHTLNLFSIKITQKQRKRDNDWEGIIIIERPFLSKTCSHHLLIIWLSFVSVCLSAHFVLITGNEKRRMELIFSFLFLTLNAVVGFLLFLHLSISSLKTHTHHNLLSRSSSSRWSLYFHHHDLESGVGSSSWSSSLLSSSISFLVCRRR